MYIAMAFARVYSAQPHVTRGTLITVEVDLATGLNAFTLVGLPDKAVEESRDRVGSALKNSGFSSPKHTNQKTVVSLAPAEVKKEGSFFDVPIALGYLMASEELSFNPEKKLFVGELALNGELQPIRGALLLAQMALQEGFTELYVPAHNAKEAALVSGITVYPVRTLSDLVRHLQPKQNSESSELFSLSPQPETVLDISAYTPPISFDDVQGQEHAKRGLEIAAAGGHNVGMYGPPGTGKTMLARAFSGILPALSRNEILEITGIHSLSGTLEREVIMHPPFRSPHHTSSHIAVIGGGSIPKPGEVTLAHRGVLFLDEFPEFDKRVIESLRQPLEDRHVHISRAHGSAKFPAHFLLISAMNPCPCGFFGSRKKTCICSPSAIARYKRKISGPIMDRIDIWLEVEHVDYDMLSGEKKPDAQGTQQSIKERVENARQKQYQRYEKKNSELSAKDIQKIHLDENVKKILQISAEKLSLSPRAYHRVIKLARTIADLDESEEIQESHVLEALQYRPKNT